ncbi:MAG: mechanosensitive ion channel family protein [Spirochaetaceae bacterium]|nr:MAG: mechanosensitive ion channel family protein [Spirochaetaceae bacterium]
MLGVFRELDLDTFLDPGAIVTIVQVLFWAVVGFLVLRVLVFVIRRLLHRRTTAQVTMLVTKAVNYTGLAAIVAISLLELGVNLTPILGAAGIVGLAVGIASQASLSNVISGLFLVSEKPFSIGDVIRIGETVGVVVSIDLLSVKLRSFDNLFIRVPNEKIAGEQVTTITRFPIRRFDFSLNVPFDADLATVFAILKAIASESTLCLREPAPIIIPLEFGDQGVKLLFGVWFEKADFVAMRTQVTTAILKCFGDAGIRLSMPRVAVYSGGTDQLFVVRPDNSAAASPPVDPIE